MRDLSKEMRDLHSGVIEKLETINNELKDTRQDQDIHVQKYHSL